MERSRNRLLLPMVSASDNNALTSPCRSDSLSSLDLIESFIACVDWKAQTVPVLRELNRFRPVRRPDASAGWVHESSDASVYLPGTPAPHWQGGRCPACAAPVRWFAS